jgi:UDP-N-acetylglucosamine 2-epimerase (non-hydrolysing)
MLNRSLGNFGIEPNYEINALENGVNLADVFSTILSEMSKFFEQKSFDLVIVQGDTTTVAASSMAAFYNKIKVAHIEAGLRSYDNHSPFPEEVHRKIVATYSDLHFVPTQMANDNLLKERIAQESIKIVGNTVIDALLDIKNQKLTDVNITTQLEDDFSHLDETKKLILVTAHRKENYGDPLKNICNAIKEVAEKRQDIQFVFPVHLNPRVSDVIYAHLSNIQNVFLIKPLNYLSLTYILNKSHFILTDSGGLQEEVTVFQKPVLILRDTTERQEGVNAGIAKLVGTKKEEIVQEINHLMDSDEKYKIMSAPNMVYGDGTSSEQIIEIIKKEFNLKEYYNE